MVRLKQSEIGRKGGDGTEEHKTGSSYINFIYPWANRNDAQDLRNLGTSSTLCFIAFSLMSTSLTLFGISFWAMIYRLPYSYVTDSSVYLDSAIFFMIAAVLTIPCTWIAWVSADNKQNNKSIPLFLILLGISIMTLVTGTALAAALRSQMLFTVDKDGSKILAESPYRSLTNFTMSCTLSQYDTNFNIRYAWNKMQRRLGCCGVTDYKDWLRCRRSSILGLVIRASKAPASCYTSVANETFRYANGCLMPMANDIALQTCLLMVLGTGVCLIQLTILIYVMGVHLGRKATLRNLFFS